jgi:hypothetical protein
MRCSFQWVNSGSIVADGLTIVEHVTGHLT